MLSLLIDVQISSTFDAMVTEEHLRPNASNATPGLVGVLILMAIAVCIYSIRMYARIRPVFKLAACDYFVTAGLVS